MRNLLSTIPKRAVQMVGSLLLLLGLATGLRIWLLPKPVLEEWAIRGSLHRDDTIAAAPGFIDPARVVRTECYRGFFRRSRWYEQAQSRAILAVLQDSMNFRGDTTPELTQKLIYYDTAGHVLGYTDLDLFTDDVAVAETSPGGFRRGAVLTSNGRQQLLRALGYEPSAP